VQISGTASNPGNISKRAEPKPFLWLLLMMTVYSTEMVHTQMVGCTGKKCFRKWAWIIADKIADLESTMVSESYFVCHSSSIVFSLNLLPVRSLGRADS
jgi:hypothetical protein